MDATLRSVKLLTKFLHSTNVHVQVLAGENLAILVRSLREANLLNDYMRHFRLNEIVAYIAGLAKESKKSRRKQHRKLQKASFRPIIESVRDCMEPVEKIKYNTDIIE